MANSGSNTNTARRRVAAAAALKRSNSRRGAQSSSALLPVAVLVASVALGLWLAATSDTDADGFGDRSALPVADNNVHMFVQQAAARGNVTLVDGALRLHRLDPQWAGGPRNTSILHALLAGWHTAIDRASFNAHEDYAAVMYMLFETASVDVGTGCPLTDAVHYRNTLALLLMLNWPSTHLSAPGHSAASAAWNQSLAECLATPDYFGRIPLHIASQSKASGLARLFVRLQAAAGNDTALEALEPTLELLDVRMLDATQGVSLRALNDATGELDVENLLSTAFTLLPEHVFHMLVNEPDAFGATALHLAAQGGRDRVVKLLHDVGADPLVQDAAFNFTAAHYAAAHGTAQLCAQFADAPDVLATVDRFGRTPVDVAAGAQPPNAACLLVWGVDPDTVADGAGRADAVPPVAAERLTHCSAACEAHVGNGWAWLHGPDALTPRPGVDLRPLLQCAGVRPVDGAALSVHDFHQFHASVGVPVVIRNGFELTQPPSSPHWSRAAVASRFRRVAVSVSAVPYAAAYGSRHGTTETSLAEFVLAAMGTGSPAADASSTAALPYVFDSQVAPRSPEVLDGIRFPDAVVDAQRVSLRQTAVGPPLTGASPHFHPAAFNGVVFGRKLWVLFPPNDAVFVGATTVLEWLATPAAAHVCTPPSSVRVAVQEAGDVVYVPPGWGHAVLNLADTFAVAFEEYP